MNARMLAPKLAKTLGAIGLTTGCLLVAAGETKSLEPMQLARVTNTQHVEFPADGVITLRNSVGTLTVEAWDQSAVEITTIKSTRREYDVGAREKELQKLDKVRIAVERKGNELLINTDYPGYRDFPPLPMTGKPAFDLEYRIKAPATARIIVERQECGDINIDGMTGDSDVNLLQGEILLHLPEGGHYGIDAKSDFGNVNSDFPGPDLNSAEKRRWWLFGHRSARENAPAATRLRLRVGFGDVVILRTRIPKAPESLIPAQKPESL